MSQLPDKLYAEIERLSEAGNERLDDHDDWRGAAALWQSALDLLPEPRTQWEAALWLYASIGDALWQGRQFEHARDRLQQALNCPDGHANPFVLLRLGQTLVDLGEIKNGTEYLLRAYMLDGEEPFGDGGEAYLELLRQQNLI